MKPRTSQDYHHRLARVIAAILAAPGDNHTVVSLARVACMSAWHFHRVYRAMTGEGVAETLRRVRLAQAARALGETGEAVTSIAMDAGYDSPQAFSRAFRQFSGVSPSTFQERHRAMTTLGAVRIIDMPPSHALTLRHAGPVETIAQTWNKLRALVRDAVPPEAMRGPIGISTGDPEGGDEFTYLAGVLAGPAPPAVPGLTLTPVPGGAYASYRLNGAYGLITATYRALFGEWLPGSGQELDDRPALEIYHTPYAQGDRADCVTDIMIPIKEPHHAP
jgi:AraC family transcriptional regulator